MGKNSKRRNYTRYRYLADDLYTRLRSANPRLSKLDGEDPMLRRKWTLRWSEMQWEFTESEWEQARTASNNEDAEAEDHKVTGLRVWLTIAQEMMFDLSPESTHLFMTDPDLVDLIESSEYEGLQTNDLCFPSDRFMIHFRRGTRIANQEVSSLLLAKFRDANEVIAQLNKLFPRSKSLESTPLPPGEYWVLCVSSPEFRLDRTTLGFYFATVTEQSFIEALSTKKLWQFTKSCPVSEIAPHILNFVAGLGVYLKSYPEALRNGPPHDVFDHEGASDVSKARKLNPMSEQLAQAVRECKAGKVAAITPHLRRMHWRRLPEDIERYPNKHGLLIPVKSCFVGKAKTVVDVTDPAL